MKASFGLLSLPIIATTDPILKEKFETLNYGTVNVLETASV